MAAVPRAPTWPPKSSQQKWSRRADGCNLHKARLGDSSSRAPGRVMPKTYGTRPIDLVDLDRSAPGVRSRTRGWSAGSERAASSRRTDNGPSRRDPRGILHAHGGGWGAKPSTCPGAPPRRVAPGRRAGTHVGRAGVFVPALRAESTARERDLADGRPRSQSVGALTCVRASEPCSEELLRTFSALP